MKKSGRIRWILGIILIFSQTAGAGVRVPACAGMTEVWVSGSLRRNAGQQTEWEAALGSGKSKILYEREFTNTGMKEGIGYDINLEQRKTWYRVSFVDVYRATQDISLQSQAVAVGKKVRVGAALAAERWGNWRGMGVLEADYEEGWVKVSSQYMTDLQGLRWTVAGGMEIPISKKIKAGPEIDYGGTEVVTYGRGKIKIILSFK